MTTTQPASQQSSLWHDPERVLDINSAAAIMTIWAMIRYVRPPFVDTDLTNTIYLAVATISMTALAARSPAHPLRLPTTPVAMRRYVPLHTKPSALEVAALVATTITLAALARLAENAVAFFTNPVVGGCGTYNDAECTNDDALTSFVGTFNAGVGEELVYRLALLTVVARFVGVRWAIAVQAIVWGVSHTWFDNGYNSSIVAGIIAVGVLYAIATLATRSVWPAIISHTLNNLTSDIDSYAPSWRWIYIAAYGAVFGATVYLIIVAAQAKQAQLRAANDDSTL